MPAPQATPDSTAGLVLSYDRLVPLALDRSLQLQIAREGVARAASEVDVARGERLPRLGIGTSYAYRDNNVVRGTFVSLSPALADTPLLTNHVLESAVSLRVPVYSGGRLEATIHQQSFLLLSETQELERTRQRVVFQVKRAFLDVLLAREKEEVARLGLMESQETLRQATARREAGTGTRFEMLQAQVAISTRKQQVVENHSELDIRQAELAALVHLPVDTRFDINETLAPALASREAVPGRDLKALTVVALDRRPELAAVRNRILATEEAQTIAASSMRPDFGLALNYQVLGGGSMLYGGFSLLAELSIPLYDGGAADARVAGLEHRKRQLKSEERRELDEIALEVRQALLSLEDVETRLQTAEDAVGQGQEEARLAQVRFSAGVGTSLELVSAQSDYANARFTLAQARYGQMVALANLNYATGVLAP